MDDGRGRGVDGLEARASPLGLERSSAGANPWRRSAIERQRQGCGVNSTGGSFDQTGTRAKSIVEMGREAADVRSSSGRKAAEARCGRCKDGAMRFDASLARGELLKGRDGAEE